MCRHGSSIIITIPSIVWSIYWCFLKQQQQHLLQRVEFVSSLWGQGVENAHYNVKWFVDFYQYVVGDYHNNVKLKMHALLFFIVY